MATLVKINGTDYVFKFGKVRKVVHIIETSGVLEDFLKLSSADKPSYAAVMSLLTKLGDGATEIISIISDNAVDADEMDPEDVVVCLSNIFNSILVPIRYVIADDHLKGLKKNMLLQNGSSETKDSMPIENNGKLD